MLLPSIQQITELHHKYAPDQAAFDLIFTHCEIVSKIAEQLINKKGIEVNRELVRVGCLLHDIGVYRLYKPDGFDSAKYISHGMLGYELLKHEGFDETICRFAAYHTGMGLTRHEIKYKHLPLPPRDFIAKTKEEQLVMYADKFHSKNDPHFNSFSTYAKFVHKFGEDKVQRFEQLAGEFGVPDLELLAEQYHAEIK